MKLLVAAGVGALLGVIGSRFIFVGSWLSLIPWAIAGLAIGLWSDAGKRRQALINGAAYGFVLVATFLLAGYQGSTPLSTNLSFFALLGILGAIGAVCGLALAAIGFLLRRTLRRA